MYLLLLYIFVFFMFHFLLIYYVHCIQRYTAYECFASNKQRLEFLSLQEDCTVLSESTLVKMPNCWKSHVAAHL